ncbi:MAG: hypothetical protein V4612_06565 [Pseudomonadota bacterium]
MRSRKRSLKLETVEAVLDLLNNEQNQDALNDLFGAGISDELQKNPQVIQAIGKFINNKYDFAKTKNLAGKLLTGKEYKLKPTPEIARLISDGLTHHLTIWQQNQPFSPEDFEQIGEYLAALERIANNAAQIYKFNQNQAITRAMYYLLESNLPVDEMALNQVREAFLGIDVNQLFPAPIFHSGNLDLNLTENNTETQSLLKILSDNHKLNKDKLLFLYGCGFKFTAQNQALLPAELSSSLDPKSERLLFGGKDAYKDASEFVTELSEAGAIKFFNQEELRKKIRAYTGDEVEDLLQYFKEQKLRADIFIALMEKGFRPQNIATFFSRWTLDQQSADNQILILEKALELYKDPDDQTALKARIAALEKSLVNDDLFKQINQKLKILGSTPDISNQLYFDHLVQAIKTSDYELVRLFRKARVFNYDKKNKDQKFFQLLNIITEKLQTLASQEVRTKDEEELQAQLLPILKIWSEYKDLSLDKKRDIALLIERCNYVFNQYVVLLDQTKTKARTPNNNEAFEIIRLATLDKDAHLALNSFLRGNKLNFSAPIFQKLDGFDAKNDCLKCLLINYPKQVTPKILATLLNNGLEITPNHIHLAQDKSGIDPEVLDMMLYARNPKLLIQKIKETVDFSNENNLWALFNFITNNIAAIKKSPEYHDELILFLLKHCAPPIYINLLLGNNILPIKRESLLTIAFYKDDYEAKFDDQKKLFAKLKPEDLKIQTIIDQHQTNKKHIGELAQFCLQAHSFIDVESEKSDTFSARISKLLQDNQSAFLPLDDSFAVLLSYAIENNRPVFIRAIRRWLGTNSESLTPEDKLKLKTAIQNSTPILATRILEFDNFKQEDATTAQINRKAAREFITTQIKALTAFLGIDEISTQLDQNETDINGKGIFKQFIDEIKKGANADLESIKKLLSDNKEVIKSEFAKDFGSSACLIDILLKYKFSPELIKIVIESGDIQPKISISNTLRHKETYAKLGAKYLLGFFDLLESKFDGTDAEKNLVHKHKEEANKNIIQIVENSLLSTLENLEAQFTVINDDATIERELEALKAIKQGYADLFTDEDLKLRYKYRLENLLILSASKPSEILFEKVAEIYLESFAKEDLALVAEKTINQVLNLYNENELLFNEDRKSYQTNIHKIDLARPEKHISFVNMIFSNQSLALSAQNVVDEITNISDRCKNIIEVELVTLKSPRSEIPSTPRKTKGIMLAIGKGLKALSKGNDEGKGSKGERT